MKYFCIWTVVVFGFLKVLVCKVSCGNGWLAKNYDSCSLTVAGRGFFFLLLSGTSEKYVPCKMDLHTHLF